MNGTWPLDGRVMRTTKHNTSTRDEQNERICAPTTQKNKNPKGLNEKVTIKVVGNLDFDE